MSGQSNAKWPKRVPELSEEQRRARDDWMHRFQESLPTEHRRLARFNNAYPLRSIVAQGRTLEIGAGLGEHLRYEELDRQEYHTIELRENMAEVIMRDFPSIQTTVGDCQERLPFPADHFERVLAIHVLEHLPNLPRALDEVKRVLRPGGILSAVIPCEGGFGYSLGRKFTVRRQFERRYGIRYMPIIRSEHVNVPVEIFEEIAERFDIVDRTFYPLRVPIVHLNLVIGITARRSPELSREEAASVR